MTSIKKLLAVAVITASAQSAFAFWDTGVDLVNKANPNDGEAILTLWDAASQLSFTQDLGVKYSALYSGSALNGQSITLDQTALSVFGGNYSNVSWNIAAANTHVKNGSVNAYTGAGYIFSFSTGTTLSAPAGITTNVTAKWNQFNPYQVNLAMNNPASPADEARSGTAAGFAQTGYQSTWINYIAGLNPAPVDYATNNTMNLWFTGYGNAGGTQSAVLNLGSATLNLAAGAHSLTLGQAPAVPVPAAAWLMGSALLGLGGLGRSRKQRA